MDLGRRREKEDVGGDDENPHHLQMKRASDNRLRIRSKLRVSISLRGKHQRQTALNRREQRRQLVT